MKHCIFLILLMMTPGFALANKAGPATDAYLGKAAPMHATAEPVFRVRQAPNAPPQKRRIASASVKPQPMIIKLKPHNNYTTVRRATKTPTMAMRPIYPPRRVVASTRTTPARKNKITATSERYIEKKRAPTGKSSKQNIQTKAETNKTGKQKLAKADS
ncbi:MAG: hypothetical protein ACKOX6_10780 [Bdellovibrio sp.]